MFFIVSIEMFSLFFRHVVSGSKLSAEDVIDGPVNTLGWFSVSRFDYNGV